MNHLIVLLMCMAGFASLSMSQERHQRAVSRRAFSRHTVVLLRVAGALLLGLGLRFSIETSSFAIGLVQWCGHLSVAAGCICLWLVYAAKHHRPH